MAATSPPVAAHGRPSPPAAWLVSSLFVLVLASASACGGGGGSPDGGSLPDVHDDAGNDGGSDGGVDGGASDGGTVDGGPEDGGPDGGDETALAVDTVATGLEVPWEVRVLPDGDLLVTERPGRLVRVDPDTGDVTQVAAFRVLQEGEAGLMGLALDPDFEANGRIYLCLTERSDPPVNRVARFVFDGTELSDGTTLVGDIRANDVHDGCRLEFGPDGFLWITVGDATVAPEAQDTNRLNGKVLRIRPDGSIPEDNPFGNAVFSYGHRNPQGIDFHPATGEPFISEHGPDSDDEVNALVAGGNYGWPDAVGPSDDPDFVDPVYHWTPTVAPSGAAFYGDDAIPQWAGAFLVVTLKEEDLRVLYPSDAEFTGVDREEIFFDARFGRLRVVRVAPDGSVLLATSNRDGRGEPVDEDDRILRVRPRE